MKVLSIIGFGLGLLGMNLAEASQVVTQSALTSFRLDAAQPMREAPLLRGDLRVDLIQGQIRLNLEDVICPPAAPGFVTCMAMPDEIIAAELPIVQNLDSLGGFKVVAERDARPRDGIYEKISIFGSSAFGQSKNYSIQYVKKFYDRLHGRPVTLVHEFTSEVSRVLSPAYVLDVRRNGMFPVETVTVRAQIPCFAHYAETVQFNERGQVVIGVLMSTPLVDDGQPLCLAYSEVEKTFSIVSETPVNLKVLGLRHYASDLQ